MQYSFYIIRDTSWHVNTPGLKVCNTDSFYHVLKFINKWIHTRDLCAQEALIPYDETSRPKRLKLIDKAQL